MISPIARFLWLKNRSLKFSVRLLLTLSVASGVAALLSLETFSQRVSRTIEKDARKFLAADFQIQASRKIPDEVVRAAVKASRGGELLRQTDLIATASSKGRDAFSVQLRALEGAYPYYGTLKSEPGVPVENLRVAVEGRAPILVDKALRAKGFKVGDVLRLGEIDSEIVGFILEEPNTVASVFALGPRVLMHQAFAEKSGLLQPGSRSFHMLLIKSQQDSKSFRRDFRALVPDPHWKLITPERANAQSAVLIERIRSFLAFVAVAALLLGGLGIFVIFRAQFILRLNEYLSLRCMGVSRRNLFAYVLLEALGFIFWGFLVGTALGLSLEHWLSGWAGAVLNVPLAEVSYWEPLTRAIIVCLTTVFAAVIFPLREVLRVPVAQGLRDSDLGARPFPKLDFLLLVLGLFALVLLVTRNLKLAATFLVGYWLYILLLWLAAAALRKVFAPLAQRLGFLFKHSLLFFVRERADSQLLWISLGSSSLILSSVLFLGQNLKQQMDFSNKIGIPNLFLLNVENGDRVALNNILPQMTFVPVIPARLKSLNGQEVQESQDADSADAEQFYRVREYTITRRDHLEEGEEIVEGASLFGEATPMLLRVSLEERFAERMKLKVGDRFNVEIAGIAFESEVRSLRKVNWFNLRPNFFMVFSAVDLAGAPMGFVGLATVPREKISFYQEEVQKLQPQISALDGESITRRLMTLLDQFALSVTAVSGFTMVASVFVFAGILMSRRARKIREIALWRVLGLSRLRLRLLPLSEFFFVSFLGLSVTGLCSFMLVYLVSRFALNISFGSPPWGASLLLWAGLSVFFSLFAFLLYQDLYKKSTNILLRDEA